MQKLYCYVDESGQDNRSDYFVVVTIVLSGSQDAFREELLMIEEMAKKLTNALRSRGASLRMVQSRREESEPLIRLADMWAGCIRGALLLGEDSMRIFQQAQKTGYLQEVVT